MVCWLIPLKGYETEVGDAGIKLSGRQHLNPGSMTKEIWNVNVSSQNEY